MSIKPVDIQIAIPRTTEVSKATGHDAAKGLAAQQQASDQVQRQTKKRTTQVYSRSGPESISIRERQKEQKNRDRNDKQERKKGNQRQNTIDIKI